MKEYKVKLKYEEDDSYVELWQLVGEKKYIGRFTCGPQKEWVYVADPLGYREMDHSLRPEITVIVCDQSGNELFRTRNGDDSVNFNTPKQEAFEKWAEFCKTNSPKVTVENQSALFFAHWASGTPAGSFNQWLLSFQDPDIYPEAKDYAENWLWCMSEGVGEPEILSTYQYLGEEKKIERIRKRHTVCGVEWDDYYSGDYFIGAGFDENRVGTMYSEAQAKKMVTEAIKKNYGENASFGLSFVEKYGWGSLDGRYVQRNVKLAYAAEKLLNRNYHRGYVDKLVKDELESSHFFLAGYKGIDAIRKEYPDCVVDTSIAF